MLGPQEFTMGGYCGSLLREVTIEVYCRRLLQEFTIGDYHGSLLWQVTLGVYQGRLLQEFTTGGYCGRLPQFTAGVYHWL